MVVDGGQMQRGAPVLAALLDVYLGAVVAHDPERLHLVQLGGHVDRRLLLLVQNARVHAAKQKRVESIRFVLRGKGDTYIESR